MKLSKYKTDTNAAKEGVWVTMEGTFEIKIARSNSPKFQTFFQKHARGKGRRFLKGAAKGSLDSDSIEALKPVMKEAAARCLIVDWRGLQEEDGSEIPYSEEKAVEILINPEYEDLFNDVLEAAQDQELYRAEEDASDAGNSSNSSPGA